MRGRTAPLLPRAVGRSGSSFMSGDSMKAEHEIIISFATGPNDFKAKRDAAAVLKGDKKTQKEVDYRLGGVDSKKRCHECKFYQKPGQPESDCARVIGIVDAEGTCDLWSQRDYNA